MLEILSDLYDSRCSSDPTAFATLLFGLSINHDGYFYSGSDFQWDQ